jgi:uncharacterized protein involved in type VI secretion and phage assembly
MALQSEYTIIISGQQIPVIKEFSLIEKMGEHTTFSLSVRADVLESSLDDTSLLGDSRQFLGQDISIQIHSIGGLEGYHEFEFKGLVTGVEMIKGFHSNSGDSILFEGESSSIVLEDGADYQSFTDKSLSNIILDAMGLYDQSKLNVAIAPENDNTLLYSVMNGESRFQYIKRLAISCGEFFFYNRDTLYFGKPNMGDEVLLTYGTDLRSFRLGLQPKSANYNYISHEYHSEETVNATTSSISSGAQGYTAFTSGISNDLFHNETTILHPSYDNRDNKQRLDALVELQKKVLEQHQVTISGSSDNPGVSLGKIIKLQNTEGSFGSYRVIEINHSAKTNGDYLNEFTAVPVDIDVSPITNIEFFSMAQPQLAKIVDTNDPEGLSRVQIRYAFDERNGVNSPWIRVATPYSGTDYGIHAIPEIGSSVIVGYHSGNIEQPYVMSALYTGVQKNANWQSENNNYKGWHTKAGNKIELNDTTNGETITITDKNNNVIKIDTANNNIEVSALENLILNAKNFQLNVEEDAVINIGKNTTIESGENLDMTSANMTNTVDGELREEIGGAYSQVASGTEIQSDGDVKIESAGLATLKGGSDVKISKG